MNSKTTPKDFFLHLGALIALYVAAGALINLSFSIINYALPDALDLYFSPSSIAWPVSMLVILVPLLYVLEWLINRDIAKMPEKKGIWVRRWRIYLTIFLTIALIGGDLIALINVYLSGEITARFIWKIVAILLVAGCVGKYYFFSVYEKYRHAKLIRKANAWFGIIIVVAAIVGGFIVIGSPAKQRELRFDVNRIDDLQSIQSEIVAYWQQQRKLPVNLDSLSDPVNGYSVPTDPETGAPYEYGIIATSTSAVSQVNTSFRLCAIFGLASDPRRGNGGSFYADSYPGVSSNLWDHAAGHACFDRTIDPNTTNFFKVPQTEGVR